MATIVEMINPLTGLPEQVDKLDHTAQEIDDAVDLAPQLSNPNLLDNWYFGNPVNQRNVSGAIDAVGYFLDRWKLVSGSVTIGSNGITLNGTIVQILEAAVGTDVTASALTAEGVVVASYDNNSKTISLTGTGQTFVAAKLELGTHQTLAHKDANGNWVLNEIPDYCEQLRRCQRYSKVYGSIQPNFGQPFFCAGFYRADSGFVQLTMVCPEFRKTPVVSILDGDWALFDGENVYNIGEINLIAYMPGVITLGITSPGNSFSNGKILILFANSGKLILSADL